MYRVTIRYKAVRPPKIVNCADVHANPILLILVYSNGNKLSIPMGDIDDFDTESLASEETSDRSPERKTH